MEIKENLKEGKLELIIEGRLDTLTAPQLEEKIENELKDVEELEFNFEKLEYISSAGLRVLLEAQKKMSLVGGDMSIKNVTDTVMEVFEATGFDTIITITKL